MVMSIPLAALSRPRLAAGADGESAGPVRLGKRRSLRYRRTVILRVDSYRGAVIFT